MEESMDEEIEYEVRCSGEWVAGSSGPQALAEDRHYAAQYAQDGPVEIWEVKKKRIL